MKKVLLLAIFIFWVTLPSEVLAEADFNIDAKVNYEFSDKGEARVTHNIRLENLKTEIFAPEFKLSVRGIDLVDYKAFDKKGALKIDLEKSPENSSLVITFSDNLVGIGKEREFSVVWESLGLATKSGSIWEIAIPKLSANDQFNKYDVVLVIPKLYGELSYLSPKPQSTDSAVGKNIYNFSSGTIKSSGLTGSFGSFQTYLVKLTYHLENPINRENKVEIAIPADTSFQKVIYEGINPPPSNVRIDENGNWLAQYVLKPRERVDILTILNIQVFPSGRKILPIDEKNLKENLISQKYWEVDDPDVVKIAGGLKEIRDIYDFVVNTLSYNYDKVKPNSIRLGAKGALKSKKDATCMEFTDLFIALTRAKGIPAREVNGYAYTENSELMPLSLVADVLHAWPEYWDKGLEMWIPVDPTWGNTTGGVDYFTKLDLRHLTFAIHGTDPNNPHPPGSYKLGANPQKDVLVTVSEPLNFKEPVPIIDGLVSRSLPFGPVNLTVRMTSANKIALYNESVDFYFDNQKKFSYTINALPPYSLWKEEIKVPFGFFGFDSPEVIEIKSTTQSKTITTNKKSLIYKNLAIFLIIILIVTTSIIVGLVKKMQKK